MNDEIILRSLTAASNIPFADEDGLVAAIDHRRARSNLTHEPSSESNDCLKPRNVQQSFALHRSMVQPKIAQECNRYRDGGISQKGLMLRRESPQYGRAKRSPCSRRDKNETVETGLDDPATLLRYENAVLKYQKPKGQAKQQQQQRQVIRDRQQVNHLGRSSSEESVARNKSKSISSIDTQSVNNILDEYEDLDYGRSSDLSESGSVNVSNFEAVMMDQQRKQQQQQERSRVGTRMQPRRSPVRERSQPVLKVNQQTQARQRSRERQKEPAKHVPPSPTEDNSSRISPLVSDAVAGRVKMPELYLRKGEVQKRVDEWLSQTQSQSYPASREKPLTRSNSSAEQKSQRRYRQDSRSRSIEEGRDKLNGTSSSYDDLSRADKKPDRRPDKSTVPVNVSRGTYKEYLALKSRNKQQDYGFSASTSAIGRSRDASPSTGSRIPQRGPLSTSFRSRRLDEAQQADNGVIETSQLEKNCRARIASDARSTGLVKNRNESEHSRISGLSGMAIGATSQASCSSSVIPCRRASLKRSQNHDQSAVGGVASRTVVKEETGPRTTGTRGWVGCAWGTATKGPSNLGDQGEPISPNKDGESRRPTLTGDSPRAGDKAADAACKSTEASRSVPRIGSESIETARYRQEKRDHNKMEQARQETVYGVVGARVRTLQGQQECRVTKPRNPRGSMAATDARKPPVLPKKDQTTNSQEERTKNSSIGPIHSTFKPNSRVYATLQQLNEQNSAKSKSAPPSRPSSDKSPARSQYNSPNHVEKIYERSLQPQVIHANDLESILRPSLQVSAYGEQPTGRSDRESPPREAVTLELRKQEEEREEEEEVYERVGELRYEHLETIEEDDRKSEASVCRYPEIGLSQCLKIQQGLPNGRPRPVLENRDQRNEPARTFVTFHSSGSSRTNSQARSETEEKRQVEPIMILDDFQLPYDPGNLDRTRTCHTRENSDLSTATIPLDELENERRMAKVKIVDENDAMEGRLKDTAIDEKSDKSENERSNSREMERVSVVNEVLLKNLQFKQDLPKEPVERNASSELFKVIEHTGAQRPIGFHNVLCDDYQEKERTKDIKVYVTKEEMERQKLMDLLRKGDYESAKTVSDHIIFLRFDDRSR